MIGLWYLNLWYFKKRTGAICTWCNKKQGKLPNWPTFLPYELLRELQRIRKRRWATAFLLQRLKRKQLCFSFLFRERYLSPDIALQRKSCLPSWFSLGFIWQVLLAIYQRPCAWQTEKQHLYSLTKECKRERCTFLATLTYGFRDKNTFSSTSNQFSALIALRILISRTYVFEFVSNFRKGVITL